MTLIGTVFAIITYMTEQIVKLIDENQNIFITGGAGVGKTTLTSSLITHYESQHKKVAKLGSTGSAAALFGGQTLHSFFEFAICSNVDELRLRGKFNLSRKLKKILKSVELIIIDEISMVSAEVLKMIMLRLQQSDYAHSLVVVGDFLQLPPICAYGVKFAFESEAWIEFDFKIFKLDKVHRTSEIEFIELLSRVRFANIEEKDEHFLNNMVRAFSKDLKDYTLLFGKNASAKAHNKRQLDSIDSQSFTYDATVTKYSKKITDATCEKFMEDSRIDKVLELKVGVPILFTKNSWNYFNGERGVVTSLNSDSIVIQKDSGVHVKLEPMKSEKSIWKEELVDGKKEFVESVEFSVFQYPITLSFAITIHKSQGMSISDLIIETNEIFAPSQFYVAISRSISSHRTILIKPQRAWKSIIYNHNVASEYVKSINNIRFSV
ncbi:MAG: DEAD/DEAH box helicase [Campylobacterota bacterium]|nr:DEAD/DEAH box helicase [Campylobacterota bacterium]